MTSFGLLLFLAAIFAAARADALIYTYENTTSGTISNGATPCTNPLVRSFVVPDSFTVNRVAIGLNVTHTRRGDVRATLVAPNGATFQFITESGDTDDNYDILVSSNTEGALDDTDADPVAQPFYNRIVTGAGIDTFFTGNALGTWALRLCDNVTTTNGTFNRAYLMLSSAVSVTATSTGTPVSTSWATVAADLTPFSSTTVGDITITQGATSDALGTASVSWVTRTTQTGNRTGFYRLSMDASGTAQDNEGVGLTSTLNFSRAVRDLRLTFLDVDITSGSWEDQVRVIGIGPSGNRVPYTLTPVATATAQLAGDLVEGDSAAAATEVFGNVDVAFAGAVSSINIDYTQGSDPANDNNFMFIGLSDFTFTAFDYGDAPNTYGTLLSGGARHVMGDRTLHLGTNPPDGEANGQAAAAATTDDTTQVGGVDDEDGVASFPAFPGGTTYTVSVTAVNRSTTQAGSLVGYIDWNRDGDFLDANERSATTSVPANTTTPTAFSVTWSSVPPNAGGTTATYARFRISFTAAEVTTPAGVATSGEVEDYQVTINTLPVSLGWFRSSTTTRGVVLEWETATEAGNAGFNAYAETAKGRARLNGALIASKVVDSLAPTTYAFEAGPTEATAFWLEEVDVKGQTRLHGPFALGVQHGTADAREPVRWDEIRRESGAKEAERQAGQSRAAETVRLLVDRTGMYRLTYEALKAAGFDWAGKPAQLLSVTNRGRAVPVSVGTAASDRAGSTWGPGSSLVFWGEAVESLYTRTNVYLLSVAKDSRSVSRIGTETRRVDLTAPPVTSYMETVTVDRNVAYSFASPTGDPWYERRLLAFSTPIQESFPIDLTDIAGGEKATLRVGLWGSSAWPESPDHHAKVIWNGVEVADRHYDGMTDAAVEVGLSVADLREGTNRVDVVLPADTGVQFETQSVDRYGVTYPRLLRAREERLGFAAQGAVIAVDGFSGKDVSVFRRAPGQDAVTQILGGFVDQGPRGLRIRFAGQTKVDEQYLVTSDAGFLSPRIAPGRPAKNLLAGEAAQMLVVAHPDFVDGIEPLATTRRAQGISVRVVDVDDVYAQYSGGVVDPQAIRELVKAAWTSWKTRSVLLVGGDTYDYHDYLGIGSKSFVPTLYAQTDPVVVRYAPVDPLFGDVDGDGVPEVAVGRLPARSSAELNALVAKTLAWRGSTRVTLAADGKQEGLDFTALSDAVADKLPRGTAVGRAYIDSLGVNGARGVLLGAMNGGGSLVSYLGHSGPTRWSFQNLLSTADAAGLSNGGRPVVVNQLGCWNNYFVEPAYNTLGHVLLVNGDRGAAAAIGIATLSASDSDELMGPELLPRLTTRGTPIGQAMIQAKKALARVSPGRPDLFLGMTLLGDPELVVNP